MLAIGGCVESGLENGGTTTRISPDDLIMCCFIE